jgi:hypothetical protein
MIQSYAAANQPPSVQRPALPAALRTALWAMCAGAALAAVRAVVYAGTGAAQKAAIEQKYPHLSPADVTTATHVAVIGGSIAGWISAALFLGVARACRQGQDWARVAGSAFFAIGVLGLLWDATHAETALNLGLGVAEAAAGLVAVVLLWQRGSGRYFDSARRR